MNRETKREEIANSITHGLGAALSIAALSVLVVFAGLRGDAWRVVSVSIYGATLVLLYLASTFYHVFSNPRVKRVFHAPLPVFWSTKTVSVGVPLTEKM